MGKRKLCSESSTQKKQVRERVGKKKEAASPQAAKQQKVGEPDLKRAKISARSSKEPVTELYQAASSQTTESHRPDTTSKQQLKAKKVGSYNVTIENDKKNCWITGIAVDKQGQKLLVDNGNKKVKLFSAEMKFLSSILMPNDPWDITVTGENEAAVTCGSYLIILETSEKKLRIKSKNKMPFEMRGICKYNDQLIVTFPFSEPQCVRLRNEKGQTDWAVSSYRGESLFISPLYVCSHGNRSSSASVFVTDCEKNIVVSLNGDTGEVLATWKKIGQEQNGAMADTAGNLYVCNTKKHVVSVLNESLTKEDILLTRKDGLSTNPYAIAFDKNAQQLIVSYAIWNIKCGDTVDVFKVTQQ